MNGELVGKLRCTAGIHPHLNKPARAMLNEAADEIERLHRCAKDNNTLARMNGEHRDEWRAKAVEAMERAEAVEQRERALKEALAGTWWTREREDVAKAIVRAVNCLELGPSDDEDCLTIYDLVPEVWCAPDRSAATDLIAENVAFAVLDAWLTAARASLSSCAGEG